MNNIRWINFLATNIGQASASDPDFGAYPGTASNVDGFYRTLTAANITGANSSFTKSNIHIEVVAKNIFDRNNREQRVLNASNSSIPDTKGSFSRLSSTTPVKIALTTIPKISSQYIRGVLIIHCLLILIWTSRQNLRQTMWVDVQMFIMRVIPTQSA